ncbi:polymeric immunoglobulin receptor-like [Chiroxiphia lanceolata]|uniref:polymeric immunoglobulin receptor-like n=1 Tax=Chiroxiphia lanceolata TaxID=296741 RepID=UPI0013CE4364|nr:polymeric immunoglobulin receptor-like [Chiroxiphia lanceolata]
MWIWLHPARFFKTNCGKKSTLGARSWKMRIFLVWILCPGVWAVKGPKQVTADQGSLLAVSCSYEPGYELNSKYWCRQRFLWFCCTDIVQTSGSEVTVTQGRVSIRDNHTAHSFTVTQSGVTLGDAGRYSCGVKRKLWFSTSHTTRVMVSAVPMALLDTPISTSCTSVAEVSGCFNHNRRQRSYGAMGWGRTVQRFVGESLSVTYEYRPGQEMNPKFWCKPGIFYTCAEDIVITSESQPVVRKGRFSIRDNRTLRVFTVTVEDLTEEDAGTYLCGVRTGRLLHDRIAEVEVIVLPGQSLHSSTPATVTTALGGRGQTTGGGVTLSEGGWRGTRCPPGTRCIRRSFTPATPTLQPDAPQGTRGSFPYFPVLAGLQLLALLAMSAAVLWVSLRG